VFADGPLPGGKYLTLGDRARLVAGSDRGFGTFPGQAPVAPSVTLTNDQGS
jgi:hypothetical protein